VVECDNQCLGHSSNTGGGYELDMGCFGGENDFFVSEEENRKWRCSILKFPCMQ
ncbi:hypothetical protein A2U01_0061958, partial [Trifolium medium]|nr:hypothetical protein [Trifolium medium]